jgi:hypothetical protein
MCQLKMAEQGISLAMIVTGMSRTSSSSDIATLLKIWLTRVIVVVQFKPHLKAGHSPFQAVPLPHRGTPNKELRTRLPIVLG